MIEIFNEAFAAGETKTFMVQGEYLEILEAAYPVTVYMMDRSGAQLSTMRNAEASFFSKPGKYEVVQIQSDQAQTVRIFIGSGDAGTRRTAGIVQVVDGGKARTIAGVAHIQSVNNVSLAGISPSNIMWNPPGSGKNIFVKALRVSVGTGQDYAAAFITALGVGLTAAPVNGLVPKKIGAASVAEGWMAQAAAFAGVTPGYSALATATLAANAVDVTKYEEPIAVGPGQGIRVFGTAAASKLVTAIEFIEEAI